MGTATARRQGGADVLGKSALKQLPSCCMLLPPTCSRSLLPPGPRIRCRRPSAAAAGPPSPPQVAPLDMFTEKNTGSNLPAQIDLYASPGSQYDFLFIGEGGAGLNVGAGEAAEGHVGFGRCVAGCWAAPSGTLRRSWRCTPRHHPPCRSPCCHRTPEPSPSLLPLIPGHPTPRSPSSPTLLFSPLPPPPPPKGRPPPHKTTLPQGTQALLHLSSLPAFLRDKLKGLGTAACPPYHLAVVVGGTSAELNLKTVKLASCRWGVLRREAAGAWRCVGGGLAGELGARRGGTRGRDGPSEVPVWCRTAVTRTATGAGPARRPAGGGAQGRCRYGSLGG